MYWITTQKKGPCMIPQIGLSVKYGTMKISHPPRRRNDIMAEDLVIPPREESRKGRHGRRLEVAPHVVNMMGLRF